MVEVEIRLQVSTRQYPESSLETESGFCAAVARLAAPQAPRSIPAPQVFRIRDWNDEAIFASA